MPAQELSNNLVQRRILLSQVHDLQDLATQLNSSEKFKARLAKLLQDLQAADPTIMVGYGPLGLEHEVQAICRHLQFFINATHHLLSDHVPEDFSEKELSLISQSLTATSTFFSAVETASEQPAQEDNNKLIDAANEMHRCAKAVHDQMGRKSAKTWISALSIVAGAAMIIAGALTAKIVAGLALIGTGSVLLYFGLHAIKPNKKEILSAEIKHSADSIAKSLELFESPVMSKRTKETDEPNLSAGNNLNPVTKTP